MRSTSWRARLMSPTASIVIASPVDNESGGVASVGEGAAVSVVVGVSAIVGPVGKDEGGSGAPAFEAQAAATSVTASSANRSRERRPTVMITRVSYGVRVRLISTREIAG